jgi:glycosyltransferase involved in cell wall biosynthesis
MIDIIIPVYNTPLSDLERCLQSILNQTSSNYIVHIIDDGSNEETKKYLDEFVNDKNKFAVTHIQNGGVSNARNVGIEISNNEYLAFVDADDTVEPNFIKEAYRLIKDNNLDIIIGGYNEIKNNQITRVRQSVPGLHIFEDNTIINFFEKLLTSKTNETNQVIGDCPTGRIYTRVFKRRSLDNLRFNTNIKMSEDTLFMIDYMNKVKRIGVTSNIWYNYYINEYSISNGTKKEKMINNIQGFIDEIVKRFNQEENPRLKTAYNLRIIKATNYLNDIKNI